MTLVVDASVVLCWLVEHNRVADWCAEQLTKGPLHAPHLLPAEVSNVLRGLSNASDQSSDQVWADFADLPLMLAPFARLRPRIWQLRHNLTAYDAWYVALAEALDAPLATLDGRLARAPGLRCRILLPEPDPEDQIGPAPGSEPTDDANHQ